MASASPTRWLAILVLVGGVDHQEIAVLLLLVDNQIIHNAASFIAHGAVAGLTVIHMGIIVGQKMIQVFYRIGSGQQDFPHMGHIEQTALGPHGHVLLDESGGILDRKEVAGKGDHLAAQGGVNVVEWRFEAGFSCHKVSPFVKWDLDVPENGKKRTNKTFVRSVF